MDPGSHVGFQISTKNTNLVEDHPVWLISVQWFQRRRFKCEKLTDGRTDGQTLTNDKSSHGLWPGELKMTHTKQQTKLLHRKLKK